jgi:hypothetical protein
LALTVDRYAWGAPHERVKDLRNWPLERRTGLVIELGESYETCSSHALDFGVGHDNEDLEPVRELLEQVKYALAVQIEMHCLKYYVPFPTSVGLDLLPWPSESCQIVAEAGENEQNSETPVMGEAGAA